jgi:hypothetical protein
MVFTDNSSFCRWHIAQSEIRGSHVIVMHHLPDSTEWTVDNEISHPRPVPVELFDNFTVGLYSGVSQNHSVGQLRQRDMKVTFEMWRYAK